MTRVLLLLLLAAGCESRVEPDPPGGRPGTEPPAVVATLLEDSARAREALEDYWDHLRAGRYSDAAALYGGNWRETAAHWIYPESVDTIDTEGFLRHTCAGMLVCDLSVQEVRDVELADPTRLRLRVVLQQAPGITFTRGPCCGEEGDAETEFTFTVRRKGDDFLVDDLPIYIP